MVKKPKKKYDGVIIKTKNGRIGIMKNYNGFKYSVFFEEDRETKDVDPDDIAFIGLSIK